MDAPVIGVAYAIFPQFPQIRPVWVTPIWYGWTARHQGPAGLMDKVRHTGNPDSGAAADGGLNSQPVRKLPNPVRPTPSTPIQSLARPSFRACLSRIDRRYQAALSPTLNHKSSSPAAALCCDAHATAAVAAGGCGVAGLVDLQSIVGGFCDGAIKPRRRAITIFRY